jgi:double-stranded uracil-DNA glycosylase
MLKPLPDILDHGLVLVFIGINPSPMAATTGHRFAGPSNRFWRVIHLAGFTPVLLRADQDRLLPRYGCGLISAVSRPTRRASELTRAELFTAGDALRAKIERHWPKWVAFLGKGAYSAIMARRDVAWGMQEKTLGAAGSGSYRIRAASIDKPLSSWWWRTAHCASPRPTTLQLAPPETWARKAQCKSEGVPRFGSEQPRCESPTATDQGDCRA